MRTPIEDITCEVFINQAGKRMWRYSDGTILPWVGGGDGPEDDTNDDDDADDEDKGGEKKPKTFSQSDLNRAARAERKAAEVKLAKSLGFETVEAMKSALEDKKSTDDKDVKDLEKVKSDLGTEKAKREKAEQDLANEKLANRKFRALVDAGLSAKTADRVAKLVEVDAEADDDELGDAIESLKTDMPQLFKASGDEDSDTTKPGERVNPPDPGNKRRKPNDKGNVAKTVQELMWERNPQTRPKT